MINSVNSNDLPEWIVEEMIAYLYSNNIILKNKELSGVVHLPVMVFPSPIPKTFFDKIEFYQIAFNKLIDRMSKDNEFLQETLKEISAEDKFVQKHLEISEKTVHFLQKQNITLGLFRNDFMVDQFKKFIYQIEINTIASSMGSHSDGVKRFFSHFSKKYPEHFKHCLKSDTNTSYVPTEKENVIDGLADSMITAIKLFSPENYQKTLIVFIVTKQDRNEFDQRAIENQLYEKANVNVRRFTLNEILEVAKYDENMNIIIENKIVSLFYFRAAYSEEHFVDEDSWTAREMIELSTAIKCPNVDYFLCTLKIFQYQLQKPEVLRRFIPEELIAKDISRFFTKIYYVMEMNDEEKIKLFDEIRGDLKRYIVKPQKEGGGNNYFEEEILKLLPADNDLSQLSSELKNSIIMERIFPPQHEGVVLRDNKISVANCVSEYSVYGAIISDEKSILLNKSFGFLIRTKAENVNEGGIATGFSAVDLPLLTDGRESN